MAADYKALTRRWFEEVWNQRRTDTIADLLSPNVISHGLGEGKRTMGTVEFRKFHEQFSGAFPDIRVIIDEVIGEGNVTAVRFRCEATHRGDHLGMKATGRPVQFSGMCMIHWNDGKIVEAWNEYDAAGMMQQLA